MAVYDEDKVFSAEAIRDTSNHNSGVSNTGEFQAETITVENGLDEQVTLQLQGSRDETTWFDVGASFNIPASTDDYETVTDYFPCYRLQASCTVAPTTGTLTCWILKSGATV
jgi:hypothetical protein